MKPVVVLSTDLTPDYLFLLPITAKTWELQGFHCDIAICHTEQVYLDTLMYMTKYINDKNTTYNTWIGEKPLMGLNKALPAQLRRLYFHWNRQYPHNTYCILSDVDMLIASNFLYRDFHRVNVFGHDLTDRHHIPICYVGMPLLKWRTIFDEYDGMPLLIYRDIVEYCNLHDKQKAWTADQDLLTGKIFEYGYDKVNFIDRGVDPNNNNLPLGRWDRYGNFKKPEGQIHDVHLMRNPMEHSNFTKIIEICNTIYPNEDWGWLVPYREEFVKNMVKQVV